MAEFVNQGKNSLTIRNKALALTENLPQKSWQAEVKAIFDYVQNDIRYVRDISGTETLHTAERVFEQQAGDCDDKAILLASYLKTIGHPVRFVAVGFEPGHFSHVITETLIGNKWVPLDPTEPYPMGWMPPHVKSRMVHNV